ncbi:MAG: hypothetical protein GWN62_22065 [Aliifodinibius sp.]|nr:hypothetical protein [Fodinibius sp.]
MNGNAFFYPEGGIAADSSHLPFYVDNVNFRFELPPGTYEYVVIAHLFGNNPLADWQAVGQYDTDSDSLPTPVALGEEQLLENILINVDFDNLPIQPF